MKTIKQHSAILIKYYLAIVSIFAFSKIFNFVSFSWLTILISPFIVFIFFAIFVITVFLCIDFYIDRGLTEIEKNDMDFKVVVIHQF
jgi:hypothetical protein